jgi:acyl carrier protein
MITVLSLLATVIDGVDPRSIRNETILKSIPGWDSMSAVTFLITIESDFSVDLSDVDLSQVATFGHLCDVLQARGIPTAALSTEIEP